MSLVHVADVRCTRAAGSPVDDEQSVLPTVVLPRRGVFLYQSAGRTVVADANTALLFHPLEPYRIAHPADDGDDCTALRFEWDAIGDALGHACIPGQSWVLDAPAQRSVHRLAHAALRANDQLERDETALRMLEVLAGSRPLPPATRDVARMEAVRELLASDLAENASLRAIGSAVDLSPFHLARRFRRHTGSSVHQYRTALRLNVARALLLDGATNITRLALDLGFSGPSHFGAAFRRAFGRRPSEVRARRY